MSPRRIPSVASIAALTSALILGLSGAGCDGQSSVPIANVPEVKTPTPRLPHPGTKKVAAGVAGAPGIVTPPRPE